MLGGMIPPKASTKGAHAVVLGGGIGGLAAAGVLARHFERVTLVERDGYPAAPATPALPVVRPHTLHGEHAHVLLAGGLCTLSRLVPDLPKWLDEAGFPEGDLTYHTRVAFEGRWLPRARSGIPIRSCTRGVVELLLARDVARRDNVRVLAESKAEGLLGGATVRGVRVARGGAEEEIAADLVVDAMGRGSPSVEWLAAMNVPPAEEIVVDPGVVYSSCWFEPPPDIDDDWTALATLPSAPRDRRMGIALRIAADRLHCSAVEYGRPRPLRSPAELVAHMERLCVPELHRLLRASRPVSNVSVFANTQNRWRRHGSLPWFPDGFVILGDAVCSLNPRYGQGMTVASLGADRLDGELSSYAAARGDLRGFSRSFQESLDEALNVPWQIALMEDQQFVTASSGASPGLAQRIVARGAARLLQTAFSDVETYVKFMRVAHLLDAPTRMLAPGTLAKIARGGRSDAATEQAPGIGAGVARTLESPRPG